MAAQRLIALAALGVLAGSAAAQNIATFEWSGPMRIYQGEHAELRLWYTLAPDNSWEIAGSIFDVTGGDALDELADTDHAEIVYDTEFNLGAAPVRIPGGWTVDIRQFASAFNPDSGCFGWGGDYPCPVFALNIDAVGSDPAVVTLECTGFHGAVGPVDVYIDSFGGQAAFEGVGVPFTFTVGGPLCLADHNRDGVVDAADITTFLDQYRSMYSYEYADINHDGTTNGLDVGVFLQRYSEGC